MSNVINLQTQSLSIPGDLCVFMPSSASTTGFGGVFFRGAGLVVGGCARTLAGGHASQPPITHFEPREKLPEFKH